MERDILAYNGEYEKAVPPAAVVEMLRNKASFALHVKAHQLNELTPSIYERIEDVRYPFVLKRADLNGSKGVRLVHSRAEYEQLCNQEPWLGHPCLLQEFIPGCVEHTMNAFFHNGRIIWSGAFSFVFSEEGIKPVGYPAVRHEPTPQELGAVESILRPLEYRGPVNIDYKIRPDGRPAILEINPRFGGSLMKPHNSDHLTQMVRMILRYAR
jgi:biotin carboxylase